MFSKCCAVRTSSRRNLKWLPISLSNQKPRVETVMKFTKQSGQVLFGTAAALVVLAGFAGLAIDMGTLRYQRRLQQTAADGAAVAGASNLAASSGEVVAAQTAATNNGFTDGSGNTLSACNDSAAVGLVCVQVTKGPTTGPHAGDIKYIEAYVSVVQPTYFMQIFGVNSRVVTARAVATATSGSTASSGCLYTLGPPTAAIEGIAINGSVVINATTCGIVDNGNYN